jgi:LuxR family transcriptional regulator, maltose regulon positive regulatory protein
MAEIASSAQRVREGEAALARAAWREARAIFEEELEAQETVDALEGLSWAAWWVEDVPVCIEARERAYRLSRQQGDVRRAAMLAVWLGDDHLVLRGERAIANGWFQRAARLLEGLEECAEHGWLDALVGYMALVEGDAARAKELAAQARGLGRSFGVVALEMFALCVEGVALVNEGRVADGMCCLDEATAAALAGEFELIVPAGWTCCMLLNACERARDYERAAEWCRKVEEFGRRMKINFVTGACRAHYGAVLTWLGRWDEAERELTRATEDLVDRPTWTGLARVRLADLRRRQGRVAEAQELLDRAAGNALTPVVLAEIALDQRDASAAADLLEPVLRRVPTQNMTLRATPVELMVRAKAMAGDAEAATPYLGELLSIAASVGTRPLHASATLAEGLVAAAAGDAEQARARFEDAVEQFAASGAAFELAQARMELARVLVSVGRTSAAVREATLAVRRLDEIGAGGEAARARELLARVGAPPVARRRSPSGEQLLTTRELEVLRLVAEGLTDVDIAARLVLSRHTVHRHLQNAYARLGCSSRAAAVAEANKLNLL